MHLRSTSVLIFVLATGLASAHPQASTSPQPQPKPPAQQTEPSRGKILFSRSSSEAAEPSTPADSALKPPAIALTDAQRSAATILSWDLDLRMRPEDEQPAMEARAVLTVRNDGDRPLAKLPLQLSSSLHWEEVRIGNRRIDFTPQTIASDADHTGALSEAVIPLAEPLARGATVALTALYGGPIPLTAARLTRIGTPQDLAAHSDWDQIDTDFLGLRGFGNVVWYPVSSVPVALGEGAKLFTEIGRQKLRQSRSTVAMHITEEFTGPIPDLAVLNGQIVPVSLDASPSGNIPGVASCSLPASQLGFAAPSLFLLHRREVDGSGIQVYVRADSALDADTAAAPWQKAASIATPFVQPWLGGKPRVPLAIIDLADDKDEPFETGGVLFTGVHAAVAPAGQPDNGQRLAGTVAHALSHAYFQSPRAWLDEGVAHFLGTLWTEQTQGRETALADLDSARGALALVEPSEPGGATGQPLAEASDPVYYRTKAAYVLWMLRDLAGDEALSAALRAYRATDDTEPGYFGQLVSKAAGKDLEWFFHDWVLEDRGLPDLSIAAVYPHPAAAAGQYIVSVDLANDGYAEAEVPLTVRSRETSVTERLRLAPRSKLAHRVLLQGLPVEVTLNDGTVPEVEASVHKKTVTQQ